MKQIQSENPVESIYNAQIIFWLLAFLDCDAGGIEILHYNYHRSMQFWT